MDYLSDLLCNVKIMCLRVICTPRVYKTSLEHMNNIRVCSCLYLFCSQDSFVHFSISLSTCLGNHYKHVCCTSKMHTESFTRSRVLSCLHNPKVKIRLLPHDCPGPLFFWGFFAMRNPTSFLVPVNSRLRSIKVVIKKKNGALSCFHLSHCKN